MSESNLREQLDAHYATTNPWARIAELQRQLAAMAEAMGTLHRERDTVEGRMCLAGAKLKHTEVLLFQVADERDAARADAVTIREVLREVLRPACDSALPGLEARIEKALISPNPGAELLAELERLRAIATTAAAYCAETVGLEATENGRKLMEAVGRPASEPEPPEHQRTAGGEIC